MAIVFVIVKSKYESLHFVCAVCVDIDYKGRTKDENPRYV